MKNMLFKSLITLSLFILPSCKYIADVGPTDIEKKEHPSDRTFKVIDLKSSNLKKYNSPHTSKSYSTPKPNPNKTYTSTISTNDTLSLLVVDNRQGGMVEGFMKMGPFNVDNTGTISIPHIGVMHVKGRTIRSVETVIQEKYTAISPSAQVTLNRTSRQNFRANIVGLVRSPGQQTIDRKGLTLTDLVARGGGTTVEPYLCQYNLHRGARTHKLTNDQINKSRIKLQDGDLLEVTKNQNYYVSVFGTAARQKNQPFTSSHTHLTDILAESGGLNGRNSNASGVFILRLKPGQQHHLYRFNLKTVEGLIAARQFHVQGRDILYVTEAPLSRWNRAIKDFLSLSDVSALANISRVAN